MKIALAQINTIAGNIKYNSQKIKDFAAKAKAAGADIAVFPELALPGGLAKDLYLRKDFLALCNDELDKLAADIALPSFVGTVYAGENAALYLKGGKAAHAASKINRFDDLRYFKNNDVEDIFDSFACCVYSCADELERAAKKASQNKASCLIVLANRIFYLGKIEKDHKIITDCAVKNGIDVVFVNMCGAQDGLVSYGSSFAVSKDGKIKALADPFEESLQTADFGISQYCDEMPEISYEEQAYDALVAGLRDYAVKNGFKKFVLGISGGIDSALVSVIAKDALGSENVTGIFMPSEFTSKQSKDDAELLCKMNGIKLLNVPITPLFEAFKSSLAEIFKGTKEDLTEENMQSRIRGMILMAYSNKFNSMVLTTGNKSEAAAGYCTLYGDSAGGYAVISDLPKTFLYKVCEYRNFMLDAIPKSILEREPTAELRHNQKDADSLPPYEVLDADIVKYMNLFDDKAEQTLSDADKNVFKMISRAEYKRRQSPPGTKITKKSFGIDVRMPLTNGYREI